jgi:hypothetical protein
MTTKAYEGHPLANLLPLLVGAPPLADLLLVDFAELVDLGSFPGDSTLDLKTPISIEFDIVEGRSW